MLPDLDYYHRRSSRHKWTKGRNPGLGPGGRYVTLTQLSLFKFQVVSAVLIEISCHDGPFETLRNAVKGRSCRLGLPFPPRPPPGPGPGGLPVFWACWAGPTSTLVTITFIGRSFEQ